MVICLRSSSHGFGGAEIPVFMFGSFGVEFSFSLLIDLYMRISTGVMFLASLHPLFHLEVMVNSGARFQFLSFFILFILFIFYFEN